MIRFSGGRWGLSSYDEILRDISENPNSSVEDKLRELAERLSRVEDTLNKLESRILYEHDEHEYSY